MTYTDHERGFLDFHEANPHVYSEVVRLARQARSHGRKKLGIAMIFEVLRWNRMVSTEHGEFKLNNSYRAYYARKAMEENRDLDGIFETREHNLITP